MIQICAKNCGQEVLCPSCDEERMNRPIVVKHFDKEMPIIIHTCSTCNVELSRSMTYEIKTIHKSFCLMCIEIIETESWKYRNLCK